MTISIGFRAPSHAEFVLEMAQEYSSSLDNDKRYTDKNLSLQHSSAEIRAEVVENLQAVLNKLQNNPHEIARVFGKMMTAPNIENNNNEVISLEDKIKLNNFVRCAWYKIPSGALCFVNGESWQCSEELAMALSEYQAIEPNSLNPGDLEFIIELNREGFLSAAEEIIEEKR